MNLGTIDIKDAQTGRAFRELILPDASQIFLDRCLRFNALAKGHLLAGWLSFLGRITQSQHALMKDYPAHHMPDADCLAFAGKRDLPPINATTWPREPIWRDALDYLIHDLLPHAPGPVQATLHRLQALDGASVEILADHILRMELNGEKAEFLPFVAAALQAHWTALAAKLDHTEVKRLGNAGICPCCGFLPVASIVREDGEITNLRYLHCGLCNTEWHLERISCAACREGGSMAYRYIENRSEAVRAETCDACRYYLKIIYREKSPQADPVADDLATLALDLMIEEAGYNRMSPNLLFTPGQ